MSINLTEGAIGVLLGDDAQNSDIKPVLQVADIRFLKTDTARTESDDEHYRILLSDGSFTQPGLLATHHNYLVHSGKLQKGSIVQLKQFRCRIIQNLRLRVILVIDLDVIVDKCDIIGEPKLFRPINTNGYVNPLASSPAPVQPMNQAAGGGGGGSPPSCSAGSVISDSVPRPVVGGGFHALPSYAASSAPPPPYTASSASSVYPQTGGVFRALVNGYVRPPQPSYNQPSSARSTTAHGMPKYARSFCKKCGRPASIWLNETVQNRGKLYNNCDVHGFSHWCLPIGWDATSSAEEDVTGFMQMERPQCSPNQKTGWHSYDIKLPTLLIANLLLCVAVLCMSVNFTSISK